MKRKIAALLMGTTLSVAVCGYSVQAMTYGYDMGGKVFISEDSSSSNLTEEEKEKLSDWHKWKKCVMNLLILNATVLLMMQTVIHCIIVGNRKMG